MMRTRVMTAVVAMWLMSGCQPGASVEDGHLVLDEDGTPAAFALVTARSTDGHAATTVWADADGRVALPHIDGPYELEFRSRRAEAEPRARVPGADIEAIGTRLALGGEADRPNPRGSSFLGQLPDSDFKRALIVDCGGCHTFDSIRMRSDGSARSAESWTTALDMMMTLYGPETGFPIISDRDVTEDVGWLTAALADAPWPVDSDWPSSSLATIGRAELTEWAVPQPLDLAHDVAVHPSGEILVTGMFTHLVYRFDPASGTFTTEPIPVENANPRAIDVDSEGRWWLLLGAAGAVARFDPGASNWESWPIGMYPHSIALDGDGDVWYNGHFTHEPELIAELSPETGDVTTLEVTSAPTPPESTIPYGLRVGADGVVWGTQLRGNRLVRHDPSTGDTRTIPMPTAESGPRRPDVGPDGSIWIPEFGANKIARFDPESERFQEFDFPAPDAAPYVVRVDQVRGTVWIGTGHGDVIGAFDPVTEQFTLYPLPTRGALIRHLDIDESTGDVWATYSASPGIGGILARLRPDVDSPTG